MLVSGRVVGGWTTPLKNMLIKLGSSSPRTRGENQKIYELPPPRKFLEASLGSFSTTCHDWLGLEKKIARCGLAWNKQEICNNWHQKSLRSRKGKDSQIVNPLVGHLACKIQQEYQKMFGPLEKLFLFKYVSGLENFRIFSSIPASRPAPPFLSLFLRTPLRVLHKNMGWSQGSVGFTGGILGFWNST